MSSEYKDDQEWLKYYQDTINKVTQDILRCKAIIQDISISHYDQTRYRQLVDEIFYETFKDTFKLQSPKITPEKCPDKLEPEEN